MTTEKRILDSLRKLDYQHSIVSISPVSIVEAVDTTTYNFYSDILQETPTNERIERISTILQRSIVVLDSNEGSTEKVRIYIYEGAGGYLDPIIIAKAKQENLFHSVIPIFKPSPADILNLSTEDVRKCIQAPNTTLAQLNELGIHVGNLLHPLIDRNLITKNTTWTVVAATTKEAVMESVTGTRESTRPIVVVNEISHGASTFRPTTDPIVLFRWTPHENFNGYAWLFPKQAPSN